MLPKHIIRQIFIMRSQFIKSPQDGKNISEIARELGISYPCAHKYCHLMDSKLEELHEHPEQLMSKRELVLLNEQRKEREAQELRQDLKNIIGSVAQELKKHGETKG